MIKAILINVKTREVTEIELNGSNADMYRVLECTTFDAIVPSKLPRGTTLYIDDEGLLVEQPIGAFSIRGYRQVLSGNGVIVGTDKEGETIDSPISVELARELVHFEDPHYLPEPGFTITSY